MYRQIIIPTDKDHSVQLPENLYGKQVEVIVKEIPAKTTKAKRRANLPSSLKNKAFWDDIEYNPTFPSIDEIRRTAWPKRNW